MISTKKGLPDVAAGSPISAAWMNKVKTLASKGVGVSNGISLSIGDFNYPLRNTGAGLVIVGRVATCTAATFESGGDVYTLGVINLWERILPVDVEDYDPGVSYLVGNYARQGGTLYRCIAPTTGTFSGGSWSAITPETDVELIDRNKATIEIKHRFHKVAPEGALIELDADGIRILTCDAPTGWV